ncbi:glucuronate isomerase [Alicyclobacillus fastidiosus]
MLCNLLGEWVGTAEAPDERELLGRIVHQICYDNARESFACKGIT